MTWVEKGSPSLLVPGNDTLKNGLTGMVSVLVYCTTGLQTEIVENESVASGSQDPWKAPANLSALGCVAPLFVQEEDAAPGQLAQLRKCPLRSKDPCSRLFSLTSPPPRGSGFEANPFFRIPCPGLSVSLSPPSQPHAKGRTHGKKR